MNETPNGTRYRVERVESDLRDVEQRVRKNEGILAQLPFLRQDWEEIRNDCKATRQYVEMKLKEQREEESEEKRLSAGQWGAVIAGVFVLLASIVQMIGTLVGAA